MSNSRMNPLDAVWLMMESDETPMHVGVLAIFKKPRNAGADYMSRIAGNMRGATSLAAPWNQRLSGPGLRLAEDQNFDLEYHFRHSALPAPGGERELGMVVSRLHGYPLDRSRPLWEFHLIEGLERDRFAFYLKVHHALINDVTAVPVMLSALSESSGQRDMSPPWSRPLHAGEEESEADDYLRELLDEPAAALGSLAKTASGLMRGMFRRGDEGGFLVPRGTPRSTLNRRIGAQRRFATQQFERARIQRLADATDSTLNEILAYLCGCSLRRFFKEYNALPDESLVAALPISLHERSERVPGNAIAGLRVRLGTHIGDPLARLAAVKESMQAVRDDRASLPEEAVTAYVILRAAPIYARQMPVLGRYVPPLFNLVVSNTPGPEHPLYYNGARLEAVYPMGQLMQFSALSIDCVSYAGTINFGFTGARDTLPHLQRLAVYAGQAVADMEELLEKEGTR